jgi:hypothetical protein
LPGPGGRPLFNPGCRCRSRNDWACSDNTASNPTLPYRVVSRWAVDLLLDSKGRGRHSLCLPSAPHTPTGSSTMFHLHRHDSSRQCEQAWTNCDTSISTPNPTLVSNFGRWRELCRVWWGVRISGVLIPGTSSRRPASQAMLQRYFELGSFLKFMQAVLGGCALYVCIWGGDLLSLEVTLESCT